jgi:hypothetical protein
LLPDWWLRALWPRAPQSLHLRDFFFVALTVFFFEAILKNLL